MNFKQLGGERKVKGRQKLIAGIIEKSSQETNDLVEFLIGDHKNRKELAILYRLMLTNENAEYFENIPDTLSMLEEKELIEQQEDGTYKIKEEVRQDFIDLIIETIDEDLFIETTDKIF